ncbi:MAG: helix-turn-helix domain-containing protein [Candidatus Aegiribacteria sp.]|nr:helix-turn-helix domain-containing protein [Candidatus Aegiribacteria sp.]
MSELKERLRLEKDPEFLQEYMVANIVEDILQSMDEEGISKSQLAKRLGKSRQYVGRVLNETANFTIKSVARIAAALGKDVVLRLKSYTEVVEIKEFVHPQEYWDHFKSSSDMKFKEFSEKEYSEDTGIQTIKVKAEEPA